MARMAASKVPAYPQMSTPLAQLGGLILSAEVRGVVLLWAARAQQLAVPQAHSSWVLRPPYRS